MVSEALKGIGVELEVGGIFEGFGMLNQVQHDEVKHRITHYQIRR